MKKKLFTHTQIHKHLIHLTQYLIALLLVAGLVAPYSVLALSPQKAVKKINSVALLPLAGSVTAPYDPFFAEQTTIADFGAAGRPFGVAAGDYDGDGKVDMVVGRTTGNVAFVKGSGDGTFAAPTVFAWKQAYYNAWAFAAGDLNGDGKLDVVWGANATSTGCSVSPVPSTGCPETITVNDGDVRVFYGSGDGTFQETAYFVSGVRHNAGTLLGRIGTIDAGSVAVGDIDGDGDADVIAGAVDGANSVVKILRNNGASFAAETLISQPTSCAAPCSPIYFPAVSTQNSPWGLAIGDADGDGDNDVFVGDRALYVYLYVNNGAGSFTLKSNNTAVSGRQNVYLGHDSFRAAVGFTPSLASGDVNGDGKADVLLGLHSGTQNPASNTANDGSILLDVSFSGGHSGFGSLADVGTMARGINVIDVNGDGSLDIIAAEYNGAIKLLRQLPPLDTDGDGVSDYVDNAPYIPNAARLDMNTDGSVNHRDQLDNDFDTVLGDPEDMSTWQRLGDPADLDDDNDGVEDSADNCPFTANSDQADKDGDGTGDACDPLDNRDSDGDGVPDGPAPGDPLYEKAKAAKIKWSSGTTHFVVRIDALGRFFQNEFTQLMTDAATLSPEQWAAKCWENYDPGDVSATYEPCGDDATKTLTLAGGKETPVTLITIPKQIWTDAPVVTWINDRNDNPLFDLGQHATYHANNTPVSDWKNLSDRNFFSCETCGLSFDESFELIKIGQDTLLGNYDNKWIKDSGATAASPKIDWSTSANPLISYAPPFNTSDTISRKAAAQLGFKSFSASIFEEQSFIFSPEGSHHEAFDQFGMFHASADAEVDPPDTSGGTYDSTAYANYLQSETQPGGLNTWLIEEVEWSGRPCNDDPRLNSNGTNAPANCAEANGAANNRENNTVYQPRWDAWIQLLDYVKNYPGGVAMTMGEVALAKGFDNAPTVYNPDQADSDRDGIGDVIEGATLTAANANLSRNHPGELSATLKNGANAPLANQTVIFSFDADGDGTAENYSGTTDAGGIASVSVTATRPIGSATFTVFWDGGLNTASGSGNVTIKEVTALSLTDAVAFRNNAAVASAILKNEEDAPIQGKTIEFYAEGKSRGTTAFTLLGTAVTNADGIASFEIPAKYVSKTNTPIRAVFNGDDNYTPSSANAFVRRQ